MTKGQGKFHEQPCKVCGNPVTTNATHDRVHCEDCKKKRKQEMWAEKYDKERRRRREIEKQTKLAQEGEESARWKLIHAEEKGERSWPLNASFGDDEFILSLAWGSFSPGNIFLDTKKNTYWQVEQVKKNKYEKVQIEATEFS